MLKKKTSGKFASQWPFPTTPAHQNIFQSKSWCTVDFYYKQSLKSTWMCMHNFLHELMHRLHFQLIICWWWKLSLGIYHFPQQLWWLSRLWGDHTALGKLDRYRRKTHKDAVFTAHVRERVASLARCKSGGRSHHNHLISTPIRATGIIKVVSLSYKFEF